MLKIGLIQAYTTSSEKFNFSPIGLCLRAIGRELRTVIFRFSDHELDQAYDQASKYFPDLFHHEFIHLSLNQQEKKHQARSLENKLFELRKAVTQGAYDLAVLLDIDIASKQGFITEEYLAEICAEKAPHTELVISGKDLPPSVVSAADLVTNMAIEKIPVPANNAPYGAAEVEVITGNGKGKTTYALGKAFLASCTGLPCLMVQFIKSPMRYGEIIASDRLPNFFVKTMGKGFIFGKGSDEEKKHRKAAKQAWEQFARELASGRYRYIILDEINIATYYDLLQGSDVARTIRHLPPNVKLILTGRNAHPDVVKAATTVIEMQEIKHPFQKGIKARKGIEF